MKVKTNLKVGQYRPPFPPPGRGLGLRKLWEEVGPPAWCPYEDLWQEVNP